MNFEEMRICRTMKAESICYTYLAEESGRARALAEAMNYSVKAGGKRIRPLLVMLACQMCGGTPEDAGPYMAAIEMIHSHSLVHDDLPAMDNDELRRGKPSTWKLYGEAAAILAGDGLLNYAYETMAKDLLEHPGDMGRVKAFSIIAQKSGHNGMIGGQSVDVETDGRKLNVETLDYIYRLKTGALLEASLMAGAALAGADQETIDRFEQIGRKVGLAFQIEDDILDVVGNEAMLGKHLNSDERNQKTTYVTLYGLDKAREDSRRLTEEALELLDSFEAEHSFLRALIESLAGREF
ncbi:MAG: polyprenyl synthetase family protein [Lachnospiraceae bacterium]|nr:polyprenyl synthetase family protein [Lachnospiraceae bacterium]